MAHSVRTLVVHGPEHPTAPNSAALAKVKVTDLHAEVGGLLEEIRPNVRLAVDSFAWSAYCDEEGKVKGLPANRVATALAVAAGWRTGDVLCGTVVFLGPANDEGDETDVPDELLALGDGLGLWVR